jgi:serine/threonine-protein kinase
MEEQNEIAFIAMEFVDGPTLDQLLSGRQPIPPQRLISTLRQTAAALDYAHQKGIVHRDIKPANIMLASDGAAKITDFGIAKVTTSQQYTQTGTILGTPNYMSPEQVQGLAVTGRADQFSLAVIAFEMLTGDRPFAGEHLTTVVYKIVAEDPPPVQRLNPTLGPQIDAVLRRGLMKKPETRFASCVDFVNALEQACANTQGWKNMPRGASLSMPTVVSQVPAGPSSAGPGSTTDELLMGRRRSASKWVLPFAAALIVALGLLGLIALQFGPGLGIHTSSQPEPAASNPPPPEVTAPAVDDKKPSPMEVPSVSAPAPTTSPDQSAGSGTQGEETKPGGDETPKLKPRPANGPQDVLLTSEPAGATAVLDGNAQVSCKTPCMLSVMPGRHTVTLNLDGYGRESREVRIIDSPIEVPLVNLRAHAGTLMLSSTPSGAVIYVNDKLISQTTPAQLSLAPGKHTVRVEKNGMRQSESVDIQNGVTSYLKIPLQ